MANSEGKKLAINNGVLLGVISIVPVVVQYSLGSYNVSGGEGNGIWSTLSFLVGVAIVVIAVLKLRKIQGGFMSFGEGFKLGFSVYIISSLFVALWMLVYCYSLEPGYQDELINVAMEDMDQNGDLTEDQIETAASWTRKFTSPIILTLFSILGAAFFGGIISAIIAAIVKRNKPVHFEETLDSEQ